MSKKYFFFLEKQCAEERYVDGMAAERLWKMIDHQKFNGQQIWDKAVAVRREITKKIIPAWDRQLNGDGALPSGVNSVDEAENSMLETLQSNAVIEKKG